MSAFNASLAVRIILGLAAVSVVDAQTVQRSAARKAVRTDPTSALLNQTITEITFEAAPLEQVMDWVTETTHANVVVRWQVLEDAGVERDKPISLRVKNLSLAQILWMIMNEAGGSDLKLAYRASGNLLVLSTADDLGKEMITKVYDIADLLVNVPQFTNAAQLDPAQALQGVGQGGGGVGGGGGGGGGGQNLFQQGQGRGGGENDRDLQGDIERLVTLITDTIEPDSWQQNGGRGSVRAFRNLLIVHNTPLVHQRIAGPVPEGD